MGSRVVYTCDRCKREYDGVEAAGKRFLTLTLNYTWLELSHRTSKVKEELWCGECVDAVRLFTPTMYFKDQDPPPVPPPSFEDLLREICREEAEAAVDRRYDK